MECKVAFGVNHYNDFIPNKDYLFQIDSFRFYPWIKWHRLRTEKYIWFAIFQIGQETWQDEDLRRHRDREGVWFVEWRWDELLTCTHPAHLCTYLSSWQLHPWHSTEGCPVLPCTNTMQYHAIPCNTMQYHAIPCNTMQYHAIPCNTMQYHAIPCNTMHAW